MASSISAAVRPAPATLRRILPAATCPSRLFFLQQQQRSLRTTARRCDNVSSSSSELGVGELQGAKFRIEPLRRVGEDDGTKRARLLYQSRKRGILESDLVLSTFAAAHLPSMTAAQLTQYDLFLDENDWDIYYWATQDEPSSSTNPSVLDQQQQDDVLPLLPRNPPKGEWAQTVGAFKPAYRPVPQRWKDSAILDLLRAHVRRRSVHGGEGTGMAFMPSLEESR